MGPALLKFLKKYATAQNLGLGAGAAGIGAGGAYLGHKATMEALPSSALEYLGLPPEMAGDIADSIEDAYGYVEEHPLAAAALAAPIGYGLSRATGDFGNAIGNIAEDTGRKYRKRKKRSK